jgi:hypothetical protein
VLKYSSTVISGGEGVIVRAAFLAMDVDDDAIVEGEKQWRRQGESVRSALIR